VTSPFKATRDGEVLRIVGEIDLGSASEFEDAVLAITGEGDDCIIDLSDLTFIDSTGIRAVIRVADRCSPTALVLRSPRPNVLKVFDITGLEAAAENVTIERT